MLKGCTTSDAYDAIIISSNKSTQRAFVDSIDLPSISARHMGWSWKRRWSWEARKGKDSTDCHGLQVYTDQWTKGVYMNRGCLVCIASLQVVSEFASNCSCKIEKFKTILYLNPEAHCSMLPSLRMWSRSKTLGRAVRLAVT